jgi:glutaredoxin
MNVMLYTRAGCHLCDDAQALLEAHGLSPQLVDVDADEVLRERFNECVPVVEIDGKIRFRGRVDPVLLRRLLRSK